MKFVLAATFSAALAFGGVAYAQSGNGGSSPKGYASGSSTSGHSGMASSRTAPKSPTAGKAGTTQNGMPGKSEGSADKMHH